MSVAYSSEFSAISWSFRPVFVSIVDRIVRRPLTCRIELHVRIACSEALADLDGSPVRVFFFEVHDQLLDLHRQLVGMPVGPAGSIGQTIDATVLVAVIDLVAGLACNAKLTGQPGHFLAIESLNSVIRKAIKKRKLFPTDDSAKKVIYLAIQDASKRWTMPIRNWKLVLNRFMIEFEDRLVDYV